MMTFIVADRTVLSKGTFKGCYIYSFKKDCSRYKTATWHEAYCSKNAEEVLARLQKLNPGKKFELA